MSAPFIHIRFHPLVPAIHILLVKQLKCDTGLLSRLLSPIPPSLLKPISRRQRIFKYPFHTMVTRLKDVSSQVAHTILKGLDYPSFPFLALLGIPLSPEEKTKALALCLKLSRKRSKPRVDGYQPSMENHAPISFITLRNLLSSQ